MIIIRKHAFFIPTTRKCSVSVESALEEISQYKLEDDENVDFILLEQNKDEISIGNQKMLDEYQRKHPEIKMYHIFAEDIDRFCTEYFLNTRKMSYEKAEELFSHVYSYGMTYNRIFVIAALLGADYIHRRDSDVFTQCFNGKKLNPFELEMKYIGKNLISVSEEYSTDDSIVYMVGGAYLGNWPISYQDIAENDVDLVYKLIKNGHPDQTDDEIIDFVQKKMIKGCSEAYEEDRIWYYSRDMVEVGSQSIYKLFKYLPIPPAEQTSGLDYMINFLLECSDNPIVYHNRRVNHVYTDERQANSWNERYHIGLAEYRAWYPINKKLKKIFSNQKCYDYSNISESMIKELDSINWNDIKFQQIEMLRNMSILYKESKNDNYINAAYVIEGNIEMIIEKVRKSVDAYKSLLKNWESLIEYASRCSVKSVCST